MRNQVLIGDCRELLKTLPDNSVQCCVTSPPYFGLRSYLPESHPDKHYEIGMERTVDRYVETMVDVFREVWRVLHPTGCVFLNLGDTYAANRGYQVPDNKYTDVGNSLTMRVPNGLKPKDLIGIPWRCAFALQNDGWWLRQDIILSKKNCMPESVTDRCTKSHEYLFLLAKSERYFYDSESIKEPACDWGTRERKSGSAFVDGTPGRSRQSGGKNCDFLESGRNRRSVWTISTAGFSGAHFAVFPPALVEPCVLAGTSEKGCCAKCGAPWERVVERTSMKIKRSYNHPLELRTRTSGTMVEPPYCKTTGWQPTCSCNADTVPCVVLDPFFGSGTTGEVAQKLGRDWIGIELNPDYAPLQQQRLRQPSLLLAPA